MRMKTFLFAKTGENIGKQRIDHPFKCLTRIWKNNLSERKETEKLGRTKKNLEQSYTPVLTASL